MYVRKICWFIPPAEKKKIISSFNNALGKYIMNEYFYHPNHQVSRLFGSLMNIHVEGMKKKTPEDEQTICTCKYMHVCAVWKFRLNLHIPHSINVIYSYWLSVKATFRFVEDTNVAEIREQHFCLKVQQMICCPNPRQQIFYDIFH